MPQAITCFAPNRIVQTGDRVFEPYFGAQAEIHKKAKKKYDIARQKCNEGIEPQYKGKWWSNEEIRKNKELKKKNLYKKEYTEATFFVPATSNVREHF